VRFLAYKKIDKTYLIFTLGFVSRFCKFTIILIENSKKRQSEEIPLSEGFIILGDVIYE